MTPAEMRIASGALSREATKWSDEQPNLQSISSSLANMAMTRIEAGMFQVMFSAYESCRAQVEARAREGAEEFGRMADTLADLSVVYSRADDSVAAEADQIVKDRW